MGSLPLLLMRPRYVVGVAVVEFLYSLISGKTLPNKTPKDIWFSKSEILAYLRRNKIFNENLYLGNYSNAFYVLLTSVYVIQDF